MHQRDSERELVAATRRGEAAAFGELYRRYGDRVYDFAYRMLGGQALAEDVTQEAFLALLEHAARYDAARGSLLAFLCGIARHRILHHLRRYETRMTEPLEARADRAEWPERSAADPLDGLLSRERAARVEAALAALPPSQRDIIVLREYQELSYGEIAAVIGADLNVVKARLHRARLALAKLLAPYLKGDRCHELR